MSKRKRGNSDSSQVDLHGRVNALLMKSDYCEKNKGTHQTPSGLLELIYFNTLCETGPSSKLVTLKLILD